MGEGTLWQGGPIVNDNQPGDYVRMYRHVHDILVQEGASNVTWVWCVNHESTSSQYPLLSQVYPGTATSIGAESIRTTAMPERG
jgi:beta-mannanase